MGISRETPMAWRKPSTFSIEAASLAVPSDADKSPGSETDPGHRARTSASLSSLLPLSSTFAPDSAKHMAQALPIPEDAPVTSIVLPLSENAVSIAQKKSDFDKGRNGYAVRFNYGAAP